MYLVGLTGGIASGKSTVSALLAEKGAGIIDADRIGHEIILRGREGYRQVVEAFGDGILGEDGEISRPRLAALVFGDREKVKRLNAITHPLIGEEMYRRMEGFRLDKGEGAIVVYDAALLIESGARDLLDILVVVAADPQVQIARLERDRDMPAEEAHRRISSQLDLEDKLALADYIIENEGSLEDLEKKVDVMWSDISRAAREKVEKGSSV
jgi:dephospho-CoA kinase